MKFLDVQHYSLIIIELANSPKTLPLKGVLSILSLNKL